MVELEAGHARRVYGLSSVSIRTFGTVLEVFDLLIFALAGIVSGWIRFGIADFSGARELFLIVGIFVCVFAFRLFKLNDPSFFTHPFTQMQRATFAVLFVFAVTLTIGFITKMSSELSRLWVGYWLIGSLFALVGTRPLVTLAYNRLKSNGSFSRNFVIFGSVDQLDTLERFLSHWGDNAQPSDKILGVFLDRSNSAQLAEFAYADMITGTVDYFLCWGNILKLHRAIIAVPANESDSAEPLLEKLRRI